jgi:hypothetical protein
MSWRKGISKNEAKSTSSTSTEIVAVPSSVKYENPSDSTAVVFFDVVKDFTTASADVWPSDEFIKAKAAELTVVKDKQAKGKELAKLFHEAFASKYSLVVSKSASFFQHPAFEPVNAASKFANSPDDLKETVWEYFRNMVQYAGMVDMYSKCPQGMLDSISNIAGSMVEKLQKGELDTANINPMEIGQMMMSSLNTSDLENFGAAMMQGGNIESMMSIMQSSMGKNGMPDLSSIMSMLPK